MRSCGGIGMSLRTRERIGRSAGALVGTVAGMVAARLAGLIPGNAIGSLVPPLGAFALGLADELGTSRLRGYREAGIEALIVTGLIAVGPCSRYRVVLDDQAFRCCAADCADRRRPDRQSGRAALRSAAGSAGARITGGHRRGDAGARERRRRIPCRPLLARGEVSWRRWPTLPTSRRSTPN